MKKNEQVNLVLRHPDGKKEIVRFPIVHREQYTRDGMNITIVVHEEMNKFGRPKRKGRWVASELSTGSKITRGGDVQPNAYLALANARETLNKHTPERIQQAINEWPIIN